MNDLILASLETFPNFVIVDADANIVFLSKKYAKLLGTTVDVAIGAPVADIIPNTRLPHVLKSLKPEMGAIMTLFDHRVGREVSVACNRIPIFKDEKLIGALGATTFENLDEITRLNEQVAVMRREAQRYKAELEQIKSHSDPLRKVIGDSPQITSIKQAIADYADSNLAILITGETGVGKEVFARAIHQLSRRSASNYVKINCAAIPENLLESELFGYAEGAFSGAARGGKIGKFELAHKGTLLLDEIGEMPLSLQSKLLRVLQEKEIEPVGSVKTVKINVRIICSTNQNLQVLVREGRFREDLYYRINSVELRLPPLRDRPVDIPPLCAHFIAAINQENGFAITGVSPDVMTLFQAYSWPGNVRELEHTLERAAVRAKIGLISAQHVDFLSERSDSQPQTELLPGLALREQTEYAEKRSILQALEQTRGNKTKAAQLLGIDRSRLYSKIKKYGLS